MYKIHVFKIDKNSNKLFIQYISSKEIDECFQEFSKKVKKNNEPEIFREIFDQEQVLKNQEEAEQAAKEAIIQLEEAGYEVIAGTPLQNKHYSIYAIELDNNPMKVYVGQTIYMPEIRLKQHLSGYNSSPKVRNASATKLRPDIYKEISTSLSKNEAEELEKQLSVKLEKQGFDVKGNGRTKLHQ